MLRAFLLTPVLALVFSWPALAPTDPDYWWHTRTGQLIAETGAIPHLDTFSFTAAGQPWIAGWRRVLDAYDIRPILIDKNGPLAAEIVRDPQWRELYVGPVERLFGRGQ